MKARSNCTKPAIFFSRKPGIQEEILIIGFVLLIRAPAYRAPLFLALSVPPCLRGYASLPSPARRERQNMLFSREFLHLHILKIDRPGVPLANVRAFRSAKIAFWASAWVHHFCTRKARFSSPSFGTEIFGQSINFVFTLQMPWWVKCGICPICEQAVYTPSEG